MTREEKLIDTLKACARQFHDYAEQHRLKAVRFVVLGAHEERDASLGKMEVNLELAERCEQVIRWAEDD